MAQCLKCGKKAAPRSVFCAECLTDMAQYPVKPGTVVHLPTRRQQTQPEETNYEDTSQAREKIISSQQKLIRFLTVMVLVVSILLVITGLLLIRASTRQSSLPNPRTNITNTTPKTP